MAPISVYCKLLRPKQWIKNAFVFFPLIFSGGIGDESLFINTLLGFVSFNFISSAVYVFNDFLDKERDKIHFLKCQRPLASGQISQGAAGVAFVLSLLAGMGIGWWVGWPFVYLCFMYLFLHVVYNFFTKKLVLLDVISIAAGFQIRVWAGCYTSQAMPSAWLQICVFVLALFLGFAKRRHEMVVLAQQALEHRPALKGYSITLLDQTITICATLAVVFYGLYTMSEEIQMKFGGGLFYSIVFVIYGLFRYLFLVYKKNGSSDAGELLFQDLPFFCCVVFWFFYVIFIIYIF